MKRNEAIGYSQALGAALVYGVAAVIQRQGLIAWGSPLVAATYAAASGLVALALLTRLVGPVGKTRATSVGAVLWMFLAGLTSGLGFVSNALALHVAPVVVVAPIGSTYALITILLARLFLQQDERVSFRIVCGGCLVAGGIVLIAIGK